MDKMRRTTSISLNSNKMIDLVVNQLEKNGKIKTNNTNDNKRKIGAKVLLDNFMTKNMKYEKDDWNNVELEELNTSVKKNKNGTMNEFLNVTFKEEDEIKKFKNQLQSVDKETNDRISQFISNKTYNRFQPYDNAAWQARQRGMKTKIVVGRFNFLLLTKMKSDTQSWYNIPPRIMHNLPDYDVGKINEEDAIEEEKQIKERNDKIMKQNLELTEAEKIKEERRMTEETEMMKRLEEIAMNDDEMMPNQEEVNEANKKKMKYDI